MPIKNKWHRLNDPKAVQRVPDKAGVYELGNENKTVIYIGQASGGRLRERIGDHVNESVNECIKMYAVFFRYRTTRAYIEAERELFREYKERHSGKIPSCNTQDPSLKH